ncbi:VOC family protein [Erythrobacter sp. BLCC-B19]|uniref:VOC family protein n=1 Tax=Erythrobacter sp. BLCC-B19 TaxID=3025315 RepID=UPI002360F8BC|nr:VOC family protein [Erythrobacter sp. BLCC-B19]WDA40110.1 VOC family protein [Erythrobacter sp. BLCC-B19]
MADHAMATCLWFASGAEEAVKFYCDLFPGSAVTRTDRAPGDYPGGKAGDVLTMNFTLLGQPFMAMNGRPEGDFSDAVSFQVFTETQAETDRLWDALVADGGAEMACSWCRDRFGIRWQIVPRVLMDALGHEDAGVRGRVFGAMMGMVKIDHAGIEAAINGAAQSKA